MTSSPLQLVDASLVEQVTPRAGDALRARLPLAIHGSNARPHAAGAARSLELLIAAANEGRSDFELVAVVSTPPVKRGRKMRLTNSPVQDTAEAAELPVQRVVQQHVRGHRRAAELQLEHRAPRCALSAARRSSSLSACLLMYLTFASRLARAIATRAHGIQDALACRLCNALREERWLLLELLHRALSGPSCGTINTR